MKKNKIKSSFYLFVIIVVGFEFICSCNKEDNNLNLTTPVLTTASVSNITKTTATCGGTITSDGGSTITERGICFSTSSEPTITDRTVTAGNGIGSFTADISGLTQNTSYHVRAFASNSLGTSYGNEQSFSTTAPSFVLGQSYGGGIIFYIDDTGQHGLIGTTSDQSTGAEWGCFGTSIQGTNWVIGSGKANTLAIVNGCNTAGIAARICDQLVLNGYSDWFLPSQDDLSMLLWADHLNFTLNKYYWSSTEDGYHIAYQERVTGAGHGDGFYDNKTNLNYVRAIRAF